MKPYYEQDGITIWNCDCRDVISSVDAAVVVADPPYGVAMARGDGKIKRRIAGDDAPFDPAVILALGLPTVLFGANAYADQLPPSTGWLIWDKTFPDCAEQSQAELAWTNFVRGIRVHREAYHGFMRKRDGWLHPAQKPVHLMRWILTLRWTPTGTVLDPYMGSGPVLVAAKQLGRRAVGIELVESYCEIAANRLAQTVMQLEGV